MKETAEMIAEMYEFYLKCNFPKYLAVAEIITKKLGKTSGRRRLGLALAVVILVGVVSYFLVQTRMSPPPENPLTSEQKEVHDFLRDYYNAYGNVSVNRLVVLFDDKAILSAPDGSIYRGAGELRSYYSQAFMGYENFTIVLTIVNIEVRGEDARAIYDVRMRTWYFGATEAPQIFTRENLGLKKTADSWIITAIVIEQTAAR